MKSFNVDINLSGVILTLLFIFFVFLICDGREGPLVVSDWIVMEERAEQTNE